MSNKKALILGVFYGLLFIFLPSFWSLFGGLTSYLSYLLEPLSIYFSTPIVIYTLCLLSYLVMLIIFPTSFAKKSILIHYSLGVFISLLIFLILALIAISQFQFGF